MSAHRRHAGRPPHLEPAPFEDWIADEALADEREVVCAIRSRRTIGVPSDVGVSCAPIRVPFVPLGVYSDASLARHVIWRGVGCWERDASLAPSTWCPAPPLEGAP